MKRYFTIASIFILSAAALCAASIRPPQGFDGQVWSGTMAIYGAGKGGPDFICTAEPIEKTPDGYNLLSAGHCVQESPDGVQFSVSDEIGGPLTPVTVVKAYLGDGLDFALFNLKTTKTYPVFVLGTEDGVQVGDKTVSVHFALGIVKQLSHGSVSSVERIRAPICQDSGCVGTFLVQEYAAPGASGSAVFSLKTHKIIGILVSAFDDPVGFSVEPISRFAKFLAGPSQPHPIAAVSAPAAIPFVIPSDVFQQLFGSAHPFTLTVHGADPHFTQSGFSFFIPTQGLELSDDYYYNVPVFLEAEPDGTYALVSTREALSVTVIPLSPEVK